jgi:hypothetical protein
VNCERRACDEDRRECVCLEVLRFLRTSAVTLRAAVTGRKTTARITGGSPSCVGGSFCGVSVQVIVGADGGEVAIKTIVHEAHPGLLIRAAISA